MFSQRARASFGLHNPNVGRQITSWLNSYWAQYDIDEAFNTRWINKIESLSKEQKLRIINNLIISHKDRGMPRVRIYILLYKYCDYLVHHNSKDITWMNIGKKEHYNTDTSAYILYGKYALLYTLDYDCITLIINMYPNYFLESAEVTAVDNLQWNRVPNTNFKTLDEANIARIEMQRNINDKYIRVAYE